MLEKVGKKVERWKGRGFSLHMLLKMNTNVMYSPVFNRVVTGLRCLWREVAVQQLQVGQVQPDTPQGCKQCQSAVDSSHNL